MIILKNNRSLSTEQWKELDEIVYGLVLARGLTISDHGFYQKDHKGPLILIYYFYLRNRYFFEVLTLYFQKKSILFK